VQCRRRFGKLVVKRRVPSRWHRGCKRRWVGWSSPGWLSAGQRADSTNDRNQLLHIKLGTAGRPGSLARNRGCCTKTTVVHASRRCATPATYSYKRPSRCGSGRGDESKHRDERRRASCRCWTKAPPAGFGRHVPSMRRLSTVGCWGGGFGTDRMCTAGCDRSKLRAIILDLAGSSSLLGYVSGCAPTYSMASIMRRTADAEGLPDVAGRSASRRPTLLTIGSCAVGDPPILSDRR